VPGTREWDAAPATPGAAPWGAEPARPGAGPWGDAEAARPGADPWEAESARPSAGPWGAAAPEAEEPPEQGPPVPVRRLLSLAIAGFAGLLTVGLIFGAQTAGPGPARIPYAVVIFGVQLLYILAWTMAMRPPALLAVGVVSVIVAGAADIAAVWPEVATLSPLGYVAVGGFVAAVVAQLLRRADRRRVTESLGATLMIVVGVVSFATLIVLTRVPAGTQAITVCLAATGASLVVARLLDTVAPWPRMAPQVPRGATGVVVGAMAGTLSSAVLGSYIFPFTPARGAIVGLVAAGAAGLADLGANYVEAGRQMAGEPPTMWIARHMQGPLGGFALAAPVAYVMSVLFLVPHG
jgi:hypothetical protein